MEESVRPEPAPRRARSMPDAAIGAAREPAGPPPGPPHLADPRALTILTTEHWSLLTARSLVYNEAFSRGSMFLTFLSASLVALGFVAGGGAGPERPYIVTAVLVLDLFVGLTTLGRMVGAGTEEINALAGMARLRHAYLEMAPELAPYFTTPSHDDITSVLAAYGASRERPNAAQTVLHGLTTMPGLVAAIDSTLAGAIAATVAVALGAAPAVALVLAVIASVALMALLAGLSGRFFMRRGQSLGSRFPAAEPSGGGQEPGRRNT